METTHVAVKLKTVCHLFVVPCHVSVGLCGLACFYPGFPSPSLIHTVKNSCIFPAKSWEWLNIQIPTLKMEAVKVAACSVQIGETHN